MNSEGVKKQVIRAVKEPALIQAGAWLSGYFRRNPDHALRIPFPPAAIPNKLSDVPIPEWPFDSQGQEARHAIEAFVDAGFLEFDGQGGFRQTRVGLDLFSWFPLRHLSIEERLDERFPVLRSLVQDRNVLDAGCGVGAYSLMLEQLGASRVFALEYGPSVLEVARSFGDRLASRVQWVRSSAEGLPLRDESVEFLFCRLVLPYVHHGRTVAEFARVLAPGARGLLMLQSPRFSFWLLRRLGPSRAQLKLFLGGMLGLMGGLAQDLSGREPRWRLLSAPFHLSYQRRPTLERLLRSHGLRLDDWESQAVKPYAWITKPG